jgi:hypothetical protein
MGAAGKTPNERQTTSALGGSGLRRLRRVAVQPAAVAAAALCLYGALAVVAVSKHGTGAFTGVGSDFTRRSHSSAAIDSLAHPRGAHLGYDGQFFLYIALDPARARHYIDLPRYRYSHILYPALARAAALGQANWVPAMLIVINLLAVVSGTYFIAKLLQARGRSPLLAGLYPLFPGVLLSFERDMAEPLAYALVALGLLLINKGWDNKRSVAAAAVAFALAALTRETTVLVPVTLALMHLAASRWAAFRTTAVFLFVVGTPYLCWIGFLHWWLPAGSLPSHDVGWIPFSGLIMTWPARDVWPLMSVAIPIAIIAVACLIRLWHERRDPIFVALCVGVTLLGIYMPSDTYSNYWSAGRMQIGTLMLAILCIGSFAANRLSSRLAVVAAVFAYLPLIVFVYSFFHLGLTPEQPK